MDEQQARENIQTIRTMIERTRRSAAESGILFLVWGILITLALIGSYILGSLKKYEWEWVNWVGFTAIGWIFSAVYGYRKERAGAVRTYVQTAARNLYIACGAGFLLVGLILPALHVFSYEAITILVSVVTGILFFVTGGLFEWPLLAGLGLFWWLGAVVLALVHGLDRLLVYTALFVVGYLVPTFLLRARFRREATRP